MKETLFITIFLCVAAATLAQPTLQRRIYLWDVTLSMQGHGGSPNIYNDVERFLVREIDSITDTHTEIHILPFQEGVLEHWNERADSEGKNEIIRKIRNYKNDKVTNTDIVASVKYLKDNNIIKPDRDNLLILLTDGRQTGTSSSGRNFGGEPALIRMIEDWGSQAERNNAFCLYVALVKGIVPLDVEKRINETPGISLVRAYETTFDKLDVIALRPAELTRVSLQDEDQTVSIPFAFRGRLPENEDIMVRVTAEDEILKINETVALKGNRITFNMNYQMEREELEMILFETIRLPLHIELVDADGIMHKTGTSLSLTTQNIELELTNEPIRTLKIRLK